MQKPFYHLMADVENSASLINVKHEQTEYYLNIIFTNISYIRIYKYILNFKNQIL
jgi:hypothetical protein